MRRSWEGKVIDKIIHLTAHLSSEPLDAFALFTADQRLESWLVPHAEVEPVIGGRYELFWQPKDRANNSTLDCRVTAVVTGQLIAFEWRSPAQFKHFANQADPLTPPNRLVKHSLNYYGKAGGSRRYTTILPVT